MIYQTVGRSAGSWSPTIWSISFPLCLYFLSFFIFTPLHSFLCFFVFGLFFLPWFFFSFSLFFQFISVFHIFLSFYSISPSPSISFFSLVSFGAFALSVHSVRISSVLPPCSSFKEDWMLNDSALSGLHYIWRIDNWTMIWASSQFNNALYVRPVLLSKLPNPKIFATQNFYGIEFINGSL